MVIKIPENFPYMEFKYEQDALQNRMILRYVQEDANFRYAYNTDFTSDFLQTIDDKNRLKEPISLSILGPTRGGKSTVGITVAGRIKENFKQKLETYNICASEYEFLNNLPKAKKHDVFVIDESKQAVFGIGSVARKLKITDVQNIIAVNNISTIWIRPDRWSFEGANLGLRVFGRCFDSSPRMIRTMIYNLQARGGAGELPMGMVFIPHYADIFDWGDEFEKQYKAKKQKWVDKEQRGEADMLYNKKRSYAESLAKNKKFQAMKNKERIVYISSILGSEWTRTESEEISIMARMILEKKI